MLFSSLCSLCIQCRGATSFVPLHVVVCSPFSHNCVHRVPVDCISISILPAGHKLWHYWALGSSTLSLMQWLFTLAHNLTQNFNLSVWTNARAISKCILYSCHVHLELALVRPSSHTKSNVIFAVFERTSRTNCRRNQAKIFQMTHNYSDDNDGWWMFWRIDADQSTSIISPSIFPWQLRQKNRRNGLRHVDTPKKIEEKTTKIYLSISTWRMLKTLSLNL